MHNLSAATILIGGAAGYVLFMVAIVTMFFPKGRG